MMTLKLTCDTCGAVEQPYVFYKLTKLGTMRVQAHTRFYVDGGKVLCRNHQPNPLPTPQNETWAEFDQRHNTEMEIEDK